MASWIQKKISKKIVKRVLIVLVPAALGAIGLNLDPDTQAGLIEGILQLVTPLLEVF